LACLREAPLHALIDQQIHGTLDEDRQVSIRHLMTQQVFQLSELVVQSLSGGELHLIPTQPERYGRATRPRRFHRETRPIVCASAAQHVRRLARVDGRSVRIERT
jgi:hypothetical protein